VRQEGQHPSPQNPEYQAPIPGLDAKGKSLEFLPNKQTKKPNKHAKNQ
jgi:hypothetical protein